MIPKIASALARVLDPIKPIDRPGQSISSSKSAKNEDGGHGPLGYSGNENAPKEGEEEHSPPPDTPAAEAEADGIPESEVREDPHNPYSEKTRKRGPALALQPGLTQVILDLSTKRQELVAGPSTNNSTGTSNYEVSAKEQKKASRLPKGSMLDKKVG